ncbi:DNA-directed RNA polymerase subunit L [Candidatus Bathyarchaeota archaeon]|nr:DNA-directed RNA polymerase subunit L [Candidatus Bathyarchaeota archaeon]MCK4474941.1 DNA-directed RNA polymerase subunit L [Candidatus Bathyarchaeota archaeon]
MKVEILKKTANELKLEVEGAGHGLCNLLQKRLSENENVDLAGYDVPHPLSSHSMIYVRTKGKVKPEEALREAVKKIHETNKGFGRELKKAFKT